MPNCPNFQRGSSIYDGLLFTYLDYFISLILFRYPLFLRIVARVFAVLTYRVVNSQVIYCIIISLFWLLSLCPSSYVRKFGLLLLFVLRIHSFIFEVRLWRALISANWKTSNVSEEAGRRKARDAGKAMFFLRRLILRL